MRVHCGQSHDSDAEVFDNPGDGELEAAFLRNVPPEDLDCVAFAGSESSSKVRSITLSSTLSCAAFAASRSAAAPDPHAFSSRALRSAAWTP